MSLINQQSNLADLIIKGQVLDSESHWNENHSQIYTLSRILVDKKFKGILVDSIVTIKSIGGVVGEELMIVSHAETLIEEYQGIFFLKRAFELNKNIYAGLSEQSFFFINEPTLHPFCLIKGTPVGLDEIENTIISTAKEHVATRKDLVKYGNSLRGVCISNLSGELEEPDLYLSFENINISEDSEYIEFDIMASASDNGYNFGKADVYLSFTEDGPFSAFPVANNQIEITRGEILESDEYSIALEDINSNEFRIQVNTLPNNPENLYRLTTVKKRFAKLKLKIENYLKLGTVRFNNFAIKGKVFYHCNGKFIPFKEVRVSEPIKGINPKPNKSVSITYSFENHRYYADAPKPFFEFYIYAKASEPTIFESAKIAVGYEINKVFFANQGTIYKNMERGDLIKDPEAYAVVFDDAWDQSFVYDGTKAFEIIIEPRNTTLLKTIGNTPVPIAKIILTLQQAASCKYSPELKFYKNEMQNKSTYKTSVPVTGSTNYLPVIADNIYDKPICNCATPVIQSFSPTEIAAGVGEILTIKGSNFGLFDNDLNSKLEFKDADQGSTHMRAGKGDFIWDNVIHWTDTEIQVKVPSTDRMPTLGKRPAGSGTFKVTNSCKISAESNTKLIIPFARMNIRRGITAYPVGLACINDFTFNNNMTAPATDAFYSAIGMWNQTINTNFKVSLTKTNNVFNATDGINSVFLDDLGADIGAGLVSSAASYAFCDGIYILKDADITINRLNLNKVNLINGATLHEVGHVLGLSHNDATPDDLMNASKSFTNNLVIEPNVKKSADMVFSISTNATQCQPYKIIQKNINCNSTNIKTTDKSIFQIFPNPMVIGQTLSINTAQSGQLQYFDILGRLRFTHKINEGQSILELPLLSAGLYRVTFTSQDNSTLFTQNIIIQ